MNLWTVPKASLLPAIVLGCLVLFTIGTLQNYGPESTLRKFHSSLHNIFVSQLNKTGIPINDWNVLRNTIQEDIGMPGGSGDQNALVLINSVLTQYSSGATYTLARTDRHTGEVRIAVLYGIAQQAPTPMVWVVDKASDSREWKISARKTLSAMSVP